MLLLLSELVQAQTTCFEKHYSNRRIIVIMIDGFGMNYYNHSEIPNLKRLSEKGIFKEVSSLMPTVTNCNNAAICCGVFPETTGITGNFFIDKNGKAEYMEDKSLVLAPTIFEKLKLYGKKSGLISSKKKTIGLLSKGTEFVLSPETADSSWVKELGPPPSIYSPDVNYWVMEAALHTLKTKKDISCLYIHTTDYPMHTWAPQDSNSLKHLKRIDDYISLISKTDPSALILITADHDVNHKDVCIDLEKSLTKKGVSIKTAISAEKDKYLKHHRGFGGTSYVYLFNTNDEKKVKKNLEEIRGVKTVLNKKEASEKYHLLPERIGDLIVLADSSTVFGDLENTDREMLPANYRTHGSEYELRVPLFVLNPEKAPDKDHFIYNKDLTSWLFEPCKH